MRAANTGGPAPLANGHASHVHPAGSPAGSGGAASGSGSGRLAPGLGAGVKGRSPRLAAKALAGVRSEAANGYIKAGGAPAAHAGPPHTAAAAEGERAQRQPQQRWGAAALPGRGGLVRRRGAGRPVARGARGRPRRLGQRRERAGCAAGRGRQWRWRCAGGERGGPRRRRRRDADPVRQL